MSVALHLLLPRERLRAPQHVPPPRDRSRFVSEAVAARLQECDAALIRACDASCRALVDPTNPFYSKVRDLKREEQAA
jgi:hypothetical protein